MPLLYTKRGFLVDIDVSTQDAELKWYASKAMNVIYSEKSDITVNTRNWFWLSKVIETCARQLKCTPNFFDYQFRSGRPISFRCIDFIISTLEFIKTGKRRFNVLNWVDLLPPQPDNKTLVSNNVIGIVNDKFGSLLLMDPVDIISLWISHQDGFDDMVATMLILFGDTDKVQQND